MTMFMEVRRDWPAFDASQVAQGGDLKDAVIPTGRHEIEEIPNPCGYRNSTWYVLKGTLIGASAKSWLQWQSGRIADREDHPNFGKPIDRGDYEVIIEK